MANKAPGNQPNNFQVLVDSDAFVSRAYPDDRNHQKSAGIWKRLKAEEISVVTTSLVIVETATVLSHREGQSLATLFLAEVIENGGFPVIHVSEEIQTAALDLFKEQTKKGTSVTDCANAVVACKFGIAEIFSFDKVYQKKFGLKLVEE